MEIQQPKSNLWLNDFEKKHIPEVVLPETIKPNQPIQVQVVFGEKPHPMMAEHYIEWVGLYFGGKMVAEQIITPEVEPQTFFMVTPQVGEWQCLVRCSIHGVWEKKFSINFS